jgi:hypothetical protein
MARSWRQESSAISRAEREDNERLGLEIDLPCFDRLHDRAAVSPANAACVLGERRCSAYRCTSTRSGTAAIIARRSTWRSAQHVAAVRLPTRWQG